MPRPARYKDKEQGLKTGNVADEATLEVEHLDDSPQLGQSSERSAPSQGEIDLARSVARRMGWVPLEEWKRDPAKWSDADQFLENKPRELETLKERLKRTGQAADAAIEDARRRAREEAEAQLRQAARNGDEETAVRAAAVVAQNAGPDPRTVAWIGSNPWFNEDPAARMVAAAICDREAQAGKSIQDQLEAAEREVRRRFPEHFAGSMREEEPVTASLREVARETNRAPGVQPGNRGTSVRAKGPPGWNDIPSGDRVQLSKFVRKMASHKLSEGDAQARLAASYWANKGEA